MAQVRQENSALKRNCASMQRELEVLQASILATAIHHSTKTQHNKHVLEPEDDSLDEGWWGLQPQEKVGWSGCPVADVLS